MKQARKVVIPLWLRAACALAAVFIASSLVAIPPSAHAQDLGWWFGNGNASSYQRRAIYSRHHSGTKRSSETEDTEPRQKRKGTEAETKPSGPLFAILSLSDQHISVYNSAGLVTRSKVSTGMPGHRTPMGIFTIIGRERYHSSNIYSGAPMPYMQRITWSGVAMHLGVVPGYPASHGCIRLPAGSAERMWGLTKIGERVVIAPREVAPSEFVHPLLPVPKMQPSPLELTENTGPRATELASAATETMPVGSPKLLNSIEYAQALKARAAADVAAATKALQDQGQRKEPAPDIRRAFSELRGAEAARTQAEAKLAIRIEALATKRDTREIERAQAVKVVAESHLADTTKKFEAALDNAVFKTPEGVEALEAERKLIAIRASLARAQAMAKDAERRLAPISVLVSKKDNKVYIRQALAPVYEAPVTIRDREAPLGTHVYIATSHIGHSLGWTVISYPNLRKNVAETGFRRRRQVDEDVKYGGDGAPPDPAQALARVEFPTEASALISERLWTGGSLIITDESLSNETSDTGTDLVVTIR